MAFSMPIATVDFSSSVFRDGVSIYLDEPIFVSRADAQHRNDVPVNGIEMCASPEIEKQVKIQARPLGLTVAQLGEMAQIRSVCAQIRENIDRREYKYLLHLLSVVYKLLMSRDMQGFKIEVEKNFEWAKNEIERGNGHKTADWMLWLAVKIDEKIGEQMGKAASRA